MRHHHDGGHETQARRFRGDPGDLRQLFVPLAMGAAGEFPGGAVGIFGRDRGRNHDVVAERRVVEAHRLGANHDLRKVSRGGQGSGGGRVEADQHFVASFLALHRSRRCDTMRPLAGGGKRVPRRHATLCRRRRRIMTATGSHAIRQRFDAPLAELIAEAAALRDSAHGRLISYSRKVFIPLTKLCRDVCHYCTFAQVPRAGKPVYLSPDEVLAIARAGAAAGCTEALFTLGDKPELRYQTSRDALKALGHETTISYLTAMCALVLRETGLLPHANPGVMTREEIASLRKVTASQGIMLESTSERLCDRGGVHYGSPDKHPAVDRKSVV